MIKDKHTNIVAAVVMIFVPLIYFFGVFQWKAAQFSTVKQEVWNGSHLYFVSFSSAFYALSCVVFILSKPAWLKIVSSSVSSFCAVVLYQEVEYGDKQWSEWSYWLILIVAANYFLFYCILEAYKRYLNHD